MTAIGLLGYGEAGRAIAASLAEEQTDICLFAYDVADVSAPLPAALCDSLQALCQTAPIIISVVTADEAVNAARSVAPYVTKQTMFLDGNSVSPGTKQKSAALIEAKGATYIDMAIMAPIHPRGHKTPLLLSGHQEARLTSLLDKLDFTYDWEGPQIGDASIVKMLRSILIKGMECLISESVTASQGLGLDSRILQSAGKTLGIQNMEKLADYVMERAATHGRRRAAEMREVAKTLEELGLSNDMSQAIAIYQDRIADMNLADYFDNDIPQDRHHLAPAMRKRQKDDR